jgi:hypothetical protein
MLTGSSIKVDAQGNLAVCLSFLKTTNNSNHVDLEYFPPDASAPSNLRLPSNENIVSFTLLLRINSFTASIIDFIHISKCGLQVSFDFDNNNNTYISGIYEEMANHVLIHTSKGLFNYYYRVNTNVDTQYLVKVSASGTPLWMSTIERISGGIISISTDRTGNSMITITNMFHQNIQITDATQLSITGFNQVTVNNTTSVLTANANGAVSSVTDIMSLHPGCYVLKINSSGYYKWTAGLTGASFSTDSKLANDSKGNVIFGIPFTYLVDDMTGQYVKNINIICPDGNLHNSLSFTPGTQGMGICLVKLNAVDGFPSWCATWDGYDNLGSLTFGSNDNIIICANQNQARQANILNANVIGISGNSIGTIAYAYNLTPFKSTVVAEYDGVYGSLTMVNGIREDTLSVYADYGMPLDTQQQRFYSMFMLQNPSQEVTFINGVQIVSNNTIPTKLILFNFQGTQPADQGTPNSAKPIGLVSLADPFNQIFANQQLNDVIIAGNRQDTQRVLIGLSNSQDNAALTLSQNQATINTGLTVNQDLVTIGNIYTRAVLHDSSNIQLCGVQVVGSSITASSLSVGNLTVSQFAQLLNSITASNANIENLSVSSLINILGMASFNNGLNVQGNATFSNNVEVKGSMSTDLVACQTLVIGTGTGVMFQ